jgi:hypothetical protein
MVEPRHLRDDAFLPLHLRHLLGEFRYLAVPSLHLRHSHYGYPLMEPKRKLGDFGRYRQFHW